MGGIHRELIPAKAMYFLNCVSSAAIWNFIAVYYQNVGFDKSQIGVLQAIPSFAFVLGAPAFGALADSLQQQRAVHYGTILFGALGMFSLQYVSNYYAMAVMIFIASAVTAPTGSLLDQTVMSFLDTVGGEYGKQRLYGGVGYGVGAYFTGQLVAMFNIDLMFPVHLASAIISMVVLSFLPPVPAIASHHTTTSATSFTGILRQLKSKPSVLCLFLVVFFLGLMFGIISSFLTLYLFNLSGGDARIVGIAIFCETMSELPAFFYADKIVSKFGTSKVLGISIAGYFVRLVYYSVMTNAWSVLPFEFLHGVTFSLSWAACTNYIYKAAAPGTSGTMMGLLSSMLNGYGKCAGTLLGGFIYSVYGPVVMFRVGTGGVLLSLVGLYIFHIFSSKEHAEEKVLALPEEEECMIVEAAGMISPAIVRDISPMFASSESTTTPRQQGGASEASPLLIA